MAQQSEPVRRIQTLVTALHLGRRRRRRRRRRPPYCQQDHSVRVRERAVRVNYRCCSDNAYASFDACIACSSQDGDCAACATGYILYGNQCVRNYIPGQFCTTTTSSSGSSCGDMLCLGGRCCAPPPYDIKLYAYDSAWMLANCASCSAGTGECNACSQVSVRGSPGTWPPCRLRDGQTCASSTLSSSSTKNNDLCMNNLCLGGRCCKAAVAAQSPGCTQCDITGNCIQCSWDSKPAKNTSSSSSSSSSSSTSLQCQFATGGSCTATSGCSSGSCKDGICCDERSSADPGCTGCSPYSGRCAMCDTTTYRLNSTTGQCDLRSQLGAGAACSTEAVSTRPCESGLCLGGFCCAANFAPAASSTGCVACNRSGLCAGCRSPLVLSSNGLGCLNALGSSCLSSSATVNMTKNNNITTTTTTTVTTITTTTTTTTMTAPASMSPCADSGICLAGRCCAASVGKYCLKCDVSGDNCIACDPAVSTMQGGQCVVNNNNNNNNNNNKNNNNNNNNSSSSRSRESDDKLKEIHQP